MLTSVYEIARNYNFKSKEIVFLHVYLTSDISITNAYRKIKKINPNTKESSVRRSASRFFSRIKQKIDWPEFLELADLGMDSIVKDLNWLRQATKTEFYQGKPVAECTDNAIRMRAAEVMMDLHGLRKQEVKISGEITTHNGPDLSALSDHELDDLEHIIEKLERQHIQN